MRPSLAAFAMLVPLLAAPLPARAAPECQVLVLRPVTDDLGNRWRPGQRLPVDIQRDGANGGAYCASGGGCLPLKVSGADAVRLTNCQVGGSIGGGDHRLTLDPRVVPKASIDQARRQDSVSDRLSALGFSNASAATLAQGYVDHSRSTTTRLVARALAGSRSAVAELKRDHP